MKLNKVVTIIIILTGFIIVALITAIIFSGDFNLVDKIDYNKISAIGTFLEGVLTPLLTIGSLTFLSYQFIQTKNSEQRIQEDKQKEFKKEQLEKMILGLKSYIENSYLETLESDFIEADYIICLNNTVRLASQTSNEDDYKEKIKYLKENPNDRINKIGYDYKKLDYHDAVSTSKKLLSYSAQIYNYISLNNIENYSYIFLCNLKPVILYTLINMFEVPTICRAVKYTDEELNKLKGFLKAIIGLNSDPFSDYQFKVTL